MYMILQKAGLKKSNSKKDAYRFIRNAILNGELEPGDPITEEWLSINLKISRTPIREALVRLQSEGLIVLENNRRTVTSISPVDILEIFEIRLLLEPYAARTCIGVINKDEVERIRDYTCHLLGDSRKYIFDSDKNRDFYSFVENISSDIRNAAQGLLKEDSITPSVHIHKIHELIISATQNQRLITITNNLQAQIGLLLKVAERIPGRVTQSMEEHLQLIDAILANDHIEAEEAMKRHIQSNKDDMLNVSNFKFIFKK